MDAKRADTESRETDELLSLIALSRVPRLGARSIRKLMDRHGDAVSALRGVERARRRSSSTSGRGHGFERRAELEAAEQVLVQARDRGVRVLGFGGRDYPPLLSNLTDPPPVVYVRGTARLDLSRCVAIVGTRTASAYGLRTAHELGRDLSRLGWVIVSGMARGIDAAAHTGALEGGAGSIGVLGSGHDHQYPPENRRLYRRMEEAGLLVSEFEPTVTPTRHTFPRRNRLIAALARAVIVVEAGDRSGALITADFALDLGRDVLTVPGRIGDPASVGCLRLLRQGAGVVTGARDVLDALGWLHDAPPPDSAALGSGTSTPHGRVFDALRGEPQTADQLALRLDAPVTGVLRDLGHLELTGLVERRSGGRFSVASTP